jgi:phosphate transport system substrate-binding protein
MAELATLWQRGFSRFQPGVRFENHLYGAASAIGGLYTGVADLVVSREIWPIETLAFEQVLGYKPTAVEVATGSFDVPTKSDSLDIFVQQDNPIAGLTLSQLKTVFGAAGKLPTWGDLGLTGEWADHPIQAYGYKLDNAGMLLFSDLVLDGSVHWSANLTGFGNATMAGGRRLDAGVRILEALSKDRYGMAIANVHYLRPGVKVLPIARAGSGYVMPTRETVRSRAYPLTRQVYIFLNHNPEHRMDIATQEFLRYVLSREGQQDVAEEGAYLPLPVALAWKELSKLNGQPVADGKF